MRLLSLPLAVFGLAGGLLVTVGTEAVPAAATCTHHILVLSAMPLELDPILAKATQGPTAVVNGRYFVTGELASHDVIMGLTGIGPADALATTKAAFTQYRCGDEEGISGVVFAGTAGGASIGSVYVPDQWTEDGVNFYPSTPSWLAVAATATRGLTLEQTTPTGDPACVCVATDGVQTPVTVQNKPQVQVGEDAHGNPTTGLTTDPFGGRAVPCAPAGSDILSCVPCQELDHSQVEQTTKFVQGAVPFADPGFFTGLLQSSPPPGSYVTSDEETAVVAKVASDNGVPFIGFRAASDGNGNTPGTGGDPLMLPGFPAQFVVYRQLAADNAATAAIAFLAALVNSDG
jgi:nucleoside phosphorylase